MRSVAAVLLAGLTVACQDPDVPTYVQTPTRPTVQIPTRLTLSALVGQGDSATRVLITARVLDREGYGIANTPLSFASAKGSLNPINLSTNSSGEAQTTLTSGVPSTVTVAGAGMTTSIDVVISAPLSVSLFVLRPEKRVPANVVADLGTSRPTPPLRFVWDFGDGQRAESTTGTITHTWQEDGLVLLSVTVTDALERVGTASASVTVRDNPEPPPPPDPPAPPPPAIFTLALTCASQTALRVDCNAVGSFAGAPLPSSFLSNVGWDWGDGTVQLGNVARTHIYPATGSYPVFVSATYGPDTVAATTTATAKP